MCPLQRTHYTYSQQFKSIKQVKSSQARCPIDARPEQQPTHGSPQPAGHSTAPSVLAVASGGEGVPFVSPQISSHTPSDASLLSFPTLHNQVTRDCGGNSTKKCSALSVCVQDARCRNNRDTFLFIAAPRPSHHHHEAATAVVDAAVATAAAEVGGGLCAIRAICKWGYCIGNDRTFQCVASTQRRGARQLSWGC